jgi:YgiT-type zinc finger domain-containing protein
MTTSDPCEYCDGTIEHRQIRARFQFHDQTIYVDQVPAWVCIHCGEQYFDAPVYKRLEAIARQRERITETICFPLAVYDMVLD